ncbi:hypothetical protein M8818_004869 [Zalaria obscura]|uniref:Uncharacterized protein n=1 Tax=Zalaria obscura TaxID=2024903 RepID=A0ACC3SDE2_9PEZI
MSKLSPSLKALINAPFARPGAVPAPRTIRNVYEDVSKAAASNDTATTMTMNSPDSLNELYSVAAPKGDAVATAELMREVGLKCIGFNGVPRTINMLNAFRAALPEDIAAKLTKQGTRYPTQANIDDMNKRGQWLWKSIYHPFDEKLYNKLADSHPDLPIHILSSEYGALFADPPTTPAPAKVGRVLTSIVAVSCLRAQTGVGPQVLSHVFGLRKAYEDGSAEQEQPVQGGRWLASDEGSTWLLETVDRLVAAISEGQGSTYAPLRSKL